MPEIVPEIKNLSRSNAEDLLLDHYLLWQQQLESSGQVPKSDTSFIHRRRRWLEWAGIIPLGLLAAGFTLLANFIILVLIFHLEI